MRVIVPEDIAKRAADFVGRAWVLDEVIDWIDHGEERFFLITGEPGSGKTALAAWLVGAGTSAQDASRSDKLARVCDGWRAAHFCVARGGGTLDPVSFAESLVRQLSDQYDDYAVAALQRIAPEISISQEVGQNWGNVVGARISNFIVGSTNAQQVYNRTVQRFSVWLTHAA
jgi:hypothetical protein